MIACGVIGADCVCISRCGAEVAIGISGLGGGVDLQAVTADGIALHAGVVAGGIPADLDLREALVLRAELAGLAGCGYTKLECRYFSRRNFFSNFQIDPLYTPVPVFCAQSIAALPRPGIHAGIFDFEIYENGILLEKHKVYVPKDGKPVPNVIELGKPAK